MCFPWHKVGTWVGPSLIPPDWASETSHHCFSHLISIWLFYRLMNLIKYHVFISALITPSPKTLPLWGFPFTTHVFELELMYRLRKPSVLKFHKNQNGNKGTHLCHNSDQSSPGGNHSSSWRSDSYRIWHLHKVWPRIHLHLKENVEGQWEMEIYPPLPSLQKNTYGWFLWTRRHFNNLVKSHILGSHYFEQLIPLPSHYPIRNANW